MTNKVARIIGVFNAKGGAGKTTTACQLSGTLGYRKFDVLLADLDPQETSVRWVALNPDSSFPASTWSGHRFGSKVASELEKMMTKYDIIVVDCAPSVADPSSWPVLCVCDLVLIPTMLSAQGLDALPAAKALVRKAKEMTGRDFPVRVVPVAARMWMSNDAGVVAGLMADEEFPTFTTASGPKGGKGKAPVSALTLGQRNAFTNAMYIGSTAHAVKGGVDATNEIEALADAALKLLDLPRNK